MRPRTVPWAPAAVLGSTLAIVAGFVAWSRVFQVDEAQNVYGLWLLATRRFAEYDFYAPPYLLLLWPVVGWAGSASELFLSMRMLWLGVFLGLGWLVVRGAGIRGRDPLLTPAVAAVGFSAPLWIYGLEIRHEGPGVLALLATWNLLAPPDGSRTIRRAYGAVGMLTSFIFLNSTKHLLFLGPLLVLTVFRPHPAFSGRARAVLGGEFLAGAVLGLAGLVGLYALAGSASPLFHAFTSFLDALPTVVRFPPRALAAVVFLQTPLLLGLLLLLALRELPRPLSVAVQDPWQHGTAAWLFFGSVVAGTLANPTPFPYNALGVVSVGWLVALKPGLGQLFGNGGSRRRVLGWGLLTVGLTLPWLLRMMDALSWPNHRQLRLMAAAEALSEPGRDRILDGAGLVPGREAIAPTWYLHLLNAPGLRGAGPGSFHSRVLADPPAVVLPSYRMNYLDDATLRFIRENYLPLAEDLWVPGGVLEAESPEWRCILLGRYAVAIEPEGRARCGGEALSSGVRVFAPGSIGCEIAPGTRITIIWLGPRLDEPPALGHPDSPLFPTPGEW